MAPHSACERILEVLEALGSTFSLASERRQIRNPGRDPKQDGVGSHMFEESGQWSDSMGRWVTRSVTKAALTVSRSSATDEGAYEQTAPPGPLKQQER